MTHPLKSIVAKEAVSLPIVCARQVAGISPVELPSDTSQAALPQPEADAANEGNESCDSKLSAQ